MKGVVDKKYCDGCCFFSGGFESVYCCNYLFYTGKQRPCPAGVGCTAKLVRKKKKSSLTVSKKGKRKVVKDEEVG